MSPTRADLVFVTGNPGNDVDQTHARGAQVSHIKPQSMICDMLCFISIYNTYTARLHIYIYTYDYICCIYYMFSDIWSRYCKKDMLLKLIQTTFVLLGSLAANADPHWRCISMARKGHPQMGVSIMVYTYKYSRLYIYIIYIYILYIYIVYI